MSDAAPKSAPMRQRELLTRALLLFALGSIAYLFAQILLYAYGRDQGIYATVADTMLRGGMPYRDAWDFKPPGIFFVYALARLVLGRGEWAIRLVEVLALASMVWAFTKYAKRFFGDARVGILGGALAVLVHAQLEFWHTAQPESFGAAVIAWALVLSTFEPEPDDAKGDRRLLAAWAAAGALYGFAALLKPPLGGGAPVSALFAAAAVARRGGGWKARSVPVLVMGASSLAVVLLCGLWFKVRGAWPDLYDTLFVFTPHYTALSWDGGATIPGAVYLAVEEWVLFWSSANFVGMAVALLLPPIATREREGLLHVFGVVGVQLVGIAWQGKYFPYHFGACLPLGGFIAGLGAWKAWERAVPSGWLGAGAYASVVYLALLGRTATRDTELDFYDRCVLRQKYLVSPHKDRAALDAKLYSVADVNIEANRKVAELLRARLSPEQTAFVWGFEPHIYDMAQRRSASRYIYDVPQRVAWAKDATRRKLMEELDRNPPTAIVVEHRDVFPVVTGDSIDSADVLPQFPALKARIAEGYRLETTIEDFDVYFARR